MADIMHAGPELLAAIKGLDYRDTRCELDSYYPLFVGLFIRAHFYASFCLNQVKRNSSHSFEL